MTGSLIARERSELRSHYPVDASPGLCHAARMSVPSSPQQPPPDSEAVVLRSYCPEDFAWNVGRQGACYHLEFGWDPAFTDWVAEILTIARRPYDRVGYQLVRAEPEQAFGQDVVDET